ncbi:MAG: acyltransferase family protein [Janthinobacterium lividum]
MDILSTKPYHENKELLISQDLKKNNLDILRFLLAVGVIYSHCYVTYYARLRDIEPLMAFSQNQIDIGSLAVNFFFAASGFLIFRSYEYSNSFGDYLKKRFYRIYPAYFVAFIVSIFLLGALGAIDRTNILGSLKEYFFNLQNKKQIILNLFTLQKVPLQNSFRSNLLPGMINESLWTIQYEFVCYLIVPIIAMLGVFKKNWIVVLLFVLSYIVFSLQNYANMFYQYPVNFITNNLNPYNLPRLFVYFFSGAYFYLYRNYILRKKIFILIAAGAIIFSCIGVHYLNLILPIAGTYLFFFIAYHPRLHFSDFTKTGDFSYGMYLYAWPIQQLFMYFLGKHLTIDRLFFGVLPVIYFAAFLSWHCIEKYFLKLKVSKLKIST